MKIEVNYNELYNLGDYMEKMFEELKKDFDEINVISESLNQVLQGSAERTISTRMKNFNANQFSKVVNYTHILGNEVTNCAKVYNAEDDEFAQKMKQEASKYGVEGGAIVSDTRYQTQNTSSGFVTATSSDFVTATSASNYGANSSTATISQSDVVNKNDEPVTSAQPIEHISKDNNNDLFIEEIGEDSKNMNFETNQVEIQSNTINNTTEVHNTETTKSKGFFGGIFGAAAAAMGFGAAKNKKDKENNNNQK